MVDLRSHFLEHNVIALLIVALMSMMSLMEDTFTFGGGGSGGATQQSAVGSAQDLNSMQLFRPHLTGVLNQHLQKEDLL